MFLPIKNNFMNTRLLLLLYRVADPGGLVGRGSGFENAWIRITNKPQKIHPKLQFYFLQYLLIKVTNKISKCYPFSTISIIKKKQSMGNFCIYWIRIRYY